MGLPALKFTNSFPWLAFQISRPILKVASDSAIEDVSVLPSTDLAVNFNTVSLGIGSLPNITDISLEMPSLEPDKFWASLGPAIDNISSLQEKYSSKIELKIKNDFTTLILPLNINLKKHDEDTFFNLYSDKFEANIFFNPATKRGGIFCGNIRASIDSKLTLHNIENSANLDPDITINEYYDAFLSALKEIGFDGINR